MSVLSTAAGGNPGLSFGSLHQSASMDPGMLQFTCAPEPSGDILVAHPCLFSLVSSALRP